MLAPLPFRKSFNSKHQVCLVQPLSSYRSLPAVQMVVTPGSLAQSTPEHQSAISACLLACKCGSQVCLALGCSACTPHSPLAYGKCAWLADPPCAQLAPRPPTEY